MMNVFALPPPVQSSGAMNPQLTLSMEKLLEHAQASGDLKLCGRNLKEFPKNCGCKYHLKDTVTTDLSRNKLSELPPECTAFCSMERFILYHNTIRSIPESIVYLQSLQFLDLSRNQLSYLPDSICQLPLQGLIVNNNRLVSLPEEIGKMATLMELDASCNEITHLPVQIGDLQALKKLSLRRNHLQEIPVEISYLQLTTLDLSGNRIAGLPVELRFMTTLVSLCLEENPLTCPPANLCSRGRVHVFKYLEIQAIKEDRKRGVLTDGEYRRSYRKTGQLDLRFANGFGADARRKRHTADSGYGSEQPLDRRWSQEFSQEALDHQHTEEARRIVLRAANCSQRSPRGMPKPKSLISTGSNSSTSSGYSSYNDYPVAPPAPPTMAPPTMAPPPQALPSSTDHRIPTNGMAPPPMAPPPNPPPTHVPSHIMPPPPTNGDLRIAPPTSSLGSTSSSSCSPGTLSPTSLHSNGLEDEIHKMMDGMFSSQDKDELDGHLNGTAARSVDNLRTGGDSPDDLEKEERRRAAHKVFGKQGPGQPEASKSPSTSLIPQLSSPRHNQPLPVPASTNPKPIKPLPSSTAKTQKPESSKMPQMQTYRQYKEQLRQQRQTPDPYRTLPTNGDTGHRTTPPDTSGQLRTTPPDTTGLHQSHSDSRLVKTRVTATRSIQSTSTVDVNGKSSYHSYDVKAMQKEAVLSYVKSKQTLEPNGRPKQSFHPSNRVPPSVRPAPPPSSIPMPSSGKAKPDSRMTYTARRDAEKSATADAHINQLKMHIESRLRVSLPEDLSVALMDGVILCHVANHVKARAVPSIHVPSPAVPKLTLAKCRRNVENFLLACRKIGVRETDLFAWDNVYPTLDPRPILTTLLALLEIAEHPTEELFEDQKDEILDESFKNEDDDEPAVIYPDLVPQMDKGTITGTGSQLQTNLQTFFFLSVFFGTLFLLYLFPANA